MRDDTYKLRSIFLQPTTTSREVVYTCPANNTAVLVSMILSNDTVGPDSILIEQYHASHTEYHNVYVGSVPGKDSLTVMDSILMVLEAGDQIVMTVATANTVAMTGVIKEYFGVARGPLGT